jgi:5-methylcytosine-specific restriction endonuclease McrA
MSKATRQCIQCSRSFIRYLSKGSLAAGKGRFCTPRCFVKYRLSLPVEKQPQWRGGIPSWNCLTCGQTFQAYCRKDGGRRSYCSIACLGAENGRVRRGVPRSSAVRRKLSNAFKGERSHFWRGGVTSANAIVRESSVYKEWRLSVFKRDKFKCVWCGSRKQLQADHIKQFAFYPALRFDVKNGRTLCEPCHRKTPTWGNNNPPKQYATA